MVVQNYRETDELLLYWPKSGLQNPVISSNFGSGLSSHSYLWAFDIMIAIYK